MALIQDFKWDFAIPLLDQNGNDHSTGIGVLIDPSGRRIGSVAQSGDGRWEWVATVAETPEQSGVSATQEEAVQAVENAVTDELLRAPHTRELGTAPMRDYSEVSSELATQILDPTRNSTVVILTEQARSIEEEWRQDLAHDRYSLEHLNCYFAGKVDQHNMMVVLADMAHPELREALPKQIDFEALKQELYRERSQRLEQRKEQMQERSQDLAQDVSLGYQIGV